MQKNAVISCGLNADSIKNSKMKPSDGSISEIAQYQIAGRITSPASCNGKYINHWYLDRQAYMVRHNRYGHVLQ